MYYYYYFIDLLEKIVYDELSLFLEILMDYKEYIKALSEFKIDTNNIDTKKLENIKPFLKLLDSVEKSSIAVFIWLG